MKAIEKELLLNEVSELLIEKDENVTLGFVLMIAGSIMFVLVLCVPKIYLSNNIYKNSVSIEELKKEYLSLKDENNILQNKIAILKYRNGVSH